MRIVGYGICGPNEADRYLEGTLGEFDRLCDDTIILLNNAGDQEREMCERYGFTVVTDNREWGKNQHRIKQEFVKNEVAELEPEATVCLDMDEVFSERVTRDRIEKQMKKGQAWHVYIANLWNEGYRSDWSFWNVRVWGWDWQEKLGDKFFEYENRPLHCGLAPRWTYHLNLHAPFLLKHYGLKEKLSRDKKIARYEKYDPKQMYREPEYYQALKSDWFEEFDEESLVERVENHITSLKQPLNKELPMKKKKKEFLIRRKADNFVFSAKENVLDTVLKQSYKGQGFELVSDTPIGEEQEVKTSDEVDETTCEVCGFEAKSPFGLRSHKRKHD